MLFVSVSVTNIRKGYFLLKKALEIINRNDIILCATGGKSDILINSENLIELGNIYDEKLMSVIYSAADVFIIPSLMDNLPNTVIESLLCGTPVIGFPVGGLTDLIQDGENGFLTKKIGIHELVETIEKFLLNPKVFDSISIRRNAVKLYDIKVQSENYINLYHKILHEN